MTVDKSDFRPLCVLGRWSLPQTLTHHKYLTLVIFLPSVEEPSSKREAWASLAFLEEKLRDMLHEGQSWEKWDIALGFH